MSTIHLAPPAARNVLHFIIDDLSTDIATYGSAMATTPHMTELAARGTRFAHAYSQFQFCVPSRASFLSGRAPLRSGILRTLRGNYDLDPMIGASPGLDPRAAGLCPAQCAQPALLLTQRSRDRDRPPQIGT